jgi:hypothetical protein
MNSGWSVAAAVLRNRPKSASSSARSVDLAGIRRAKWVQGALFVGPYGHTTDPSGTFRTVSLEASVNKSSRRLLDLLNRTLT